MLQSLGRAKFRKEFPSLRSSSSDLSNAVNVGIALQTYIYKQKPKEIIIIEYEWRHFTSSNIIPPLKLLPPLKSRRWRPCNHGDRVTSTNNFIQTTLSVRIVAFSLLWNCLNIFKVCLRRGFKVMKYIKTLFKQSYFDMGTAIFYSSRVNNVIKTSKGI